MDPRPAALALLVVLAAVTATSLAAPVRKPAPPAKGAGAQPKEMSSTTQPRKVSKEASGGRQVVAARRSRAVRGSVIDSHGQVIGLGEMHAEQAV